MDKIKLSIIVPTVGRISLIRSLASITSQIVPGDQLIVLHDSSNDWGATPRTIGMSIASGTHLLFIDDDDVYVPGAFDKIRKALIVNSNSPHMFRMVRNKPYYDTLWNNPEVIEGNVSTQIFVVPNDKTRLGKWSKRYQCDYDFIVSTLELYPSSVEDNALVWSEEVISIWR